ncbi:hypothetical protein OEB96_16515 [Paraliomyxa miuraensis]|nr:hypothetical protein [Paraliomyxa miuraensis]
MNVRRIGKRVAMVMALGALTVGCGDDSGVGSGEDSSSGSDTGASESTTAVADSTSTSAGSGSAEGSSSSSSSSGDPPVEEVVVEGEVIDFVNTQPIPGSEIALYDNASINTMSDGEGLFSLGPLTPNSVQTFVLAPSADYWGAIIPVDVGTDPLQEGVQLSQIPSEFVDLQIMFLQPQMPVPPDLNQAIIIVRLTSVSAVSDGPPMVEMMPAPEDGTYYAPDASGAPILNQTTIENTLLPFVVYFNVPDTDPGDISLSATHPTRECTVVHPAVPTLGQHISLFEIECPAA